VPTLLRQLRGQPCHILTLAPVTPRRDQLAVAAPRDPLLPPKASVLDIEANLVKLGPESD
jgi:hypothetical protein